MKSPYHYLYWIVRDLARWCVNTKMLSTFLSKNCLRLYLSIFYFSWVGKFPKWNSPRDFNEWLLLTSYQNSKSPLRDVIARCVDKFDVREYVQCLGYGDTLNEVIGVYDNVDGIEFSSLPNKFVMKMTNASGRNLICEDKGQLDWPKVCDKFREWLSDDLFGCSSGEWQYSLIKPRVVIEKYIEHNSDEGLIDYKFNCIHGKVFSCFVGYNRNPNNPHREVCFDDYTPEWKRTDRIKESWHRKRVLIPKPVCLDKMIREAEALSAQFPYCRVDLYSENDIVIFGEMTFSPQGCVLEFYDDKFLKDALEFAINKKGNE